MIKLIDYQIVGPRTVAVSVTDGVHTQIVTAIEVYDSDYRTDRVFYAFGKKYILRSQLEYRENEGTCSVARIISA